jgi:hypothetical protein
VGKPMYKLLSITSYITRYQNTTGTATGITSYVLLSSNQPNPRGRLQPAY